jgi:porphobilinogen synthase
MLRQTVKRVVEFRGRRLRAATAMRSLVRETRVSVDQLVQPIFVHGGAEAVPIASMPGIQREPLTRLPIVAQELSDAGVQAVMVFGIPNAKDAFGSGAYGHDGIVQRALPLLRAAVPQMLLITDVCLCEYTDHGHCGVVRDGVVDNDATLELLARTAVAQAAAGADVVAPSAMMDGQVAAIRAALDEAGHSKTAILSYAAKYASAFYGPFREAAGSVPRFGDRRGYQMDPSNARQAMREIEADVREGADLVLVKPALPCLDVLRQARDRFDVPIGAYQVSGEYSQIKAAAQQGWLDEDRAVVETLTAIARAGADFTVTYFAKTADRILSPNEEPR